MSKGTKRRTPSGQQRAGGNILSLLAMLVLLIGGGYYLVPAVMSGDPLWFSTSFDARPRLIAVIDRGQRLELRPGDPRFDEIVDAFNSSLKRGYQYADFGFSDETWARVERSGLVIEATYAEPVRLHTRGGFQPTRQLLLVVGGENLHATRVLFRGGNETRGGTPIQVNNLEPLEQVLERHGFRS